MNRSFTTTTQPLWGNKPIKEYHEIMDAIIPFAKVIDCPKNKKLNLMHSGQDVCYFLFEGYSAFSRSSDGLVLSHIRAPHIAGLCNIIFPYSGEYHLRAETKCVIMMANTEVVKKIIQEHNLWESMATTLAYQAYKFSDIINRLSGRSSYELICNQLIALMDEPEDIRLNIIPAQYIMNTTLLSRSYVMKILSKLKKNHKIVIENKMLTSVAPLIHELKHR